LTHSDEWETVVTGLACGLVLELEDAANGYLTRTDWDRIRRTVNVK
jgi:hypothetical protein